MIALWDLPECKPVDYVLKSGQHIYTVLHTAECGGKCGLPSAADLDAVADEQRIHDATSSAIPANPDSDAAVSR